jgi:hypothetical protein
MNKKIKNKSTGWKVKSGGPIFEKKMKDCILKLNTGTRKNNLIASGSDEELRLIKSRFNRSALGPNRILVQKNGELRSTRRRVTHKEIAQKVKDDSISTILANKELIKSSNLTDDQLMTLMSKLIDCKIIGESINIEAEYMKLMGLSKPKLERQVGTYPDEPNANQTKQDTESDSEPESEPDSEPKTEPKTPPSPPKPRTRRSKFKLKPPPIVYDTTTCDEQTEFPDSSDSE